MAMEKLLLALGNFKAVALFSVTRHRMSRRMIPPLPSRCDGATARRVGRGEGRGEGIYGWLGHGSVWRSVVVGAFLFVERVETFAHHLDEFSAWHLKVVCLHDGLINRFDYDGDYGTVLNRFLMQAAIDYPMTVHGTGGQTRAFIHIRDTVRCVELAISNPPAAGERVAIMNQMTETHRLIDLAEMISKMTGVPYELVENPRKEAAENDLVVCNDSFLRLGLKPTHLREGLAEEVTDIARRFAHRCDRSKIPCASNWLEPETDTRVIPFKIVGGADIELSMAV